jgi:hypothetical protein|tara:strand:+ start:60 stop:995 length:936 start_codon:yes stop_codon:yes gene_type:complete
VAIDPKLCVADAADLTTTGEITPPESAQSLEPFPHGGVAPAAAAAGQRDNVGPFPRKRASDEGAEDAADDAGEPPRCDDEGGGSSDGGSSGNGEPPSRRALTAMQGAADTKEAWTSERSNPDRWTAEWHRRVECWWIGLPTPEQSRLGACVGALALHLGSKLDAAWRAAAVAAGKTFRPSASLSAAAEPNCQWLSQMDAPRLPGFPDVPIDPSQWTLPPIPRMLPSWQRLQALQRPREPMHSQKLMLAHSDERAQPRSRQAMNAAAGAAIGFAGGVAVLLGLTRLGGGCSRIRLGRWQMHKSASFRTGVTK